MSGTAEQRNTNTCLGILAHVDAGKTTLSEAMLYLSGRLRKLGRVDHRDSFFDTERQERARGITILAKQADFTVGERRFSLLDTPGHVDFSAEAERTLQVLDYAILVISASDGVQAHTETLWQLLTRYAIPTFLFITKMDLPSRSRAELMDELRERLSDGCADFTEKNDELMERAALCDEEAMERYLTSGTLSDAELTKLIRERKLFPCFFGSGLKTEGVEEFLRALADYTVPRDYGDAFAARVYRITRDTQGNRLTHIKCTGGELKVRDLIRYTDENGETVEEKISAIRIPSGAKAESVELVCAGDVCALTGLNATYPGQGLGEETEGLSPVLAPVLSYRVLPPEGMDAATLLPKLRLLQQEDPQLRLTWNERLSEISVQLMGKVQTEVLIGTVRERFDIDVTLDQGRILYKETIASKVEGVGHFEPLRHYAEVHLILEPLPAGSGIVLCSVCPEDALDRNWQRLILTHLAERQHAGVLTGSPITDMRITLAAGRAHIKHTEGGDFRQATYRAVRQGLMQAKSVLLEPWYAFAIEVPAEQIGRAISDVRAMSGSFESPTEHGSLMRLEGSAPVSELNGYAETLAAYTRGRGRLSLRSDGYKPCHNAEQVIAPIGYDAARDVENTADSVFCSHGAGVNIPWDKVSEYMHLDSVLRPARPEAEQSPVQHRSLNIDERELEAIMEREFGPIRRAVYSEAQRNAAPEWDLNIPARKEYVIIDGYNLIFAWDELKTLAAERLDLARNRLANILTNYAGFTKHEVVLVFDGFRTPGNPGSKQLLHNLRVSYTKDGETADAYIERLVDGIGKNYAVRVVTNDNLIRLSALRSGVLRCSSGEFVKEVEWVLSQIDEILRQSNEGAHRMKLKDGIE